MRLHDTNGNRLYLNAEERAAFLAVARRQPARDRTLCETLHWTGCRPSELLEITPARIDLSGGTIAIRSLKKRRDATGQQKVVFRSVPVPPEGGHPHLGPQPGQGLAGRHARDGEAAIPDGPHRSPKGLRHGYGVHAIVQGVPLNLLQRWLGHAQLSTTASYADAVGREEQDIAARMWRSGVCSQFDTY